MDGDYELCQRLVKTTFVGIKNHFVYPKQRAGAKIDPARYVHKCERDSTC